MRSTCGPGKTAAGCAVFSVTVGIFRKIVITQSCFCLHAEWGDRYTSNSTFPPRRILTSPQDMPKRVSRQHTVNLMTRNTHDRNERRLTIRRLQSKFFTSADPTVRQRIARKIQKTSPTAGKEVGHFHAFIGTPVEPAVLELWLALAVLAGNDAIEQYAPVAYPRFLAEKTALQAEGRLSVRASSQNLLSGSRRRKKPQSPPRPSPDTPEKPDPKPIESDFPSPLGPALPGRSRK